MLGDIVISVEKVESRLKSTAIPETEGAGIF